MLRNGWVRGSLTPALSPQREKEQRNFLSLLALKEGVLFSPLPLRGEG